MDAVARAGACAARARPRGTSGAAAGRAKQKQRRQFTLITDKPHGSGYCADNVPGRLYIVRTTRNSALPLNIRS